MASPAAAAADSREVMFLISGATSAQGVLSVLEEEMIGSSLNLIQVSAAFNRLVKTQATFTFAVRTSPALAELMKSAKLLLQLDEMGAQPVVNIFWAVARLRTQAPELQRLVPSLIEASRRRVELMSAEAVGSTCWACATLKLHRSQLEGLMLVLAGRAVEVADDLTAQGISNMIWAAAKTRSPALLEITPLLLDMATARVDEMLPGAIGMTMWAVGALRLKGPSADAFLGAVLRKAEPELPAFSSQQIAHMCTGLAAAGWKNATFMRAVADAVDAKAPGLTGRKAMQDLPEIALAFAKLDFRSDRMLSTIASSMSRMLPQMNSWGLCALAWSFDRLDVGEGTSGEFLGVHAEVAHRGLTASDVKRAQLGPEEWWHRGRP